MSVELRLTKLEADQEKSVDELKRDLDALKKQATTLEKLAATAGKLGFDDLIKVMLAVITISGFISGGVMFVVNAKTSSAVEMAERNKAKLEAEVTKRVSAINAEEMKREADFKRLGDKLDEEHNHSRKFEAEAISIRSKALQEISALNRAVELGSVDRYKGKDQAKFEAWLDKDRARESELRDVKERLILREMDKLWQVIDKLNNNSTLEDDE